MTSSVDRKMSDLSINAKNRHQYYETAVASSAEADREIREAQERGHQRRLQEERRGRIFKRIWVTLLVLAASAAVYFLAILVYEMQALR